MTEGRPATIYLAAEEGKVEEVQRYIREGQDINTPDSFGQCPLHYAAVFGRVEVIEALLTAGASVNCETANGTRPLHYAARNGQADCVEKLAARGAEANAKDREGWTPLHYACFRGHQRSAQALLSHGAAVNEPNTQGHTALHLACNRGFIDVAVALIQAGADLAATSKRGEPPLAFLPLQEKAPMMYLTSADLGTAGLREAMLAMLRDGLHSDVSVRVASAPAGSSPLRAHRCVLAARSPALREALSANPDLREIEVKDAGETAVRWFLEWCYAGSLPPVFHERPTATETVLSAIELLQLARYYAPAADDIRRAAQPIVANNITEPVARRLWAVIGPDVDSWRPISDHLISTVIRTASSATAHDLLDPLRAVPPNKLTAILKDLPIKVPEQPKPAAPVAAAPVVAAAPPLATPVAPVAASRAAAAAPPAPPLPPPPPPAAAAVPAPYLMPYTGPIVPAPAPSTRIVPFTVAATCPPVVQMQIDRTNKVIGARLDVPMTAADVGMCRKIADTLNKHKNSFFFRKPVDPIRDGIPSYYSVIKDPIDLQTLKVCLFPPSFPLQNLRRKTTRATKDKRIEANRMTLTVTMTFPLIFSVLTSRPRIFIFPESGTTPVTTPTDTRRRKSGGDCE